MTGPSTADRDVYLIILVCGLGLVLPIERHATAEQRERAGGTAGPAPYQNTTSFLLGTKYAPSRLRACCDGSPLATTTVVHTPSRRAVVDL